MESNINVKILNFNLKNHAIINIHHSTLFSCKCYACNNEWFPIYKDGSIIRYSLQIYIHRFNNLIELISCPVCGYDKIKIDAILIKDGKNGS
jgi:hypothetical protein